MSEDKKPYRNATEEELKKYLRGELSAREAHDLERKVLDDEFEGDALSGWEQHDVEVLESDLKNLRGRLNKKSSDGFYWMKVAAIGLLLLISGYTAWKLADDSLNEQTITQKMEEEKVEQPFEIPETEMIEESEQETAEQELAEEESEEIEPAVKNVPPVQKTEPVLSPKVRVDEKASKPVVQAIPEEAPASEEELGAQEDMETDLAMNKSHIVVDLDSGQDIVFDYSIAAETGAGRPEGDRVVSKKKVYKTVSVRSLDVAPTSASEPVDDTDMGMKTITGVVRDGDSMEPIAGVTVMVEGTLIGAVTDLDGQYTITVPEEHDELTYQFIGYENEKKAALNSGTIDVEMGADLMALEEVVVVGYGSQKKEVGLTGAVSTIEETEFDIVYQRPQPIEGMDAFKDYIERNKVYPEKAAQNEIEGTVKLKLTISDTGRITNIDVKRSLGYGCDKEAIRLIEEGPKWESAIKDDRRVESEVTVRIKFP